MIKKLILALALSLLIFTGIVFGNNKASPAQSADSFVKQNVTVVKISNMITSQEVSAIPAVEIVLNNSAISSELLSACEEMMINVSGETRNGGECATLATTIPVSISSDAAMTTREYAKKRNATFT